MTRIIAALSEATRVEQAINSATRESLDLNELIAGVIEGYRSIPDAPTIESSLLDTPVNIEGSEDLLVQALDKLMDNARDFCPADGAIGFSLTKDSANAVIAVENDGPPLTDSMRDKLFESMVSDRQGKSEQVHMGLGLTIVRLVAEFHGGQVTADNRESGDGVVFKLVLPLD